MIVKQGNREFISIENYNGRVIYFVYKVDGRWPIGRESSYQWIKCDKCGTIVGTQFGGFSRHTKACEKRNIIESTKK